jgi:hypothetical protein
MSDMKIKFGEPEHGWLPVSLVAEDYTLDMDVSDVPVDPLGLLVSSLSKAVSGIEGEVWWHLEPDGFYFTFGRTEDDYCLRIESAHVAPERETRTSEFELSGSLEDIILPFWRALREFESHGYSEPAWPDFPKAEMTRLTELIEDKKG